MKRTKLQKTSDKQRSDIGMVWRISASQPPNPIMGWDKDGDKI